MVTLLLALKAREWMIGCPYEFMSGFDEEQNLSKLEKEVKNIYICFSLYCLSPTTINYVWRDLLSIL